MTSARLDDQPAGAAPMRALGRRLESARRRRGWSYRDFEDQTGMSRSTLQYLVRRRQTAPDYYELTALVRALGETWDDEWERLWRQAAEAPRGTVDAATGSTSPAPVPAQLPPDVFAFAGRARELAELDRVLDAAASAMTVVVSGTAGVGKTALAIRWARRSAASFPDGRLYVNLRGYDTEQPLPPQEALAGFLRALGVADQNQSADLATRSAAYRSLTEGRRMLIVLDNASSADQVRPLLPGSQSCRVLVTSRDALPGLVARDGARRLDLDLLTPDDARALLAELVGDRADREPAAADALLARAARLPLAIRIVAELAASRPGVTLADLDAELADHGDRLDAMDTGDDPQTAVRTVFSWSYEGLEPDLARMFRRLGLHPGGGFDAAAAAALADLPPGEAERQVDLLVRAHLVDRAGRRYALHDLLRAYAAERAASDETAEQCAAAVDRLLDHYLHTSGRAVDVLYPDERTVRPPPATPSPPATTSTTSGLALDRASAMDWLVAERSNLVAAVAHSANHDGRHATRIAQTVARYLDVGGHSDDAISIHTHALAAARCGGDRVAEGAALNNLGVIQLNLGRFPAAEGLFRESLEVRRAVGDTLGEGRALNNLGIAFERMGRYDDVLECYQQSLTLRHRHGDRSGEAHTRGNLGVVCYRIGRYPEAIEYLTSALVLFRELGNRAAEAYTLDNLAGIDLRMAREEQALDRARQALPIFREVGVRAGEATSLGWIAVVAMRRGDCDVARDRLAEALEIQCEIGARDGEAETLGHLAELAGREGRWDDAIRHGGRAVELTADLGDPDRHTHALNDLGDALVGAGDPAAARSRYEAALVEARTFALPYEHGRALDGLGAVAYDRGQPEAARRDWTAAVEIFDALGVPEAGRTRRRLAELP